MELDYIKDLIMIAKCKNLYEAADNLFVSQSALSRHVRSIEEYLNMQLFERSAHNMVLNKYGEIFLKYAQQMLPSGCKFHPRCKHCMQQCKTTQPTLTKINENHYVACLEVGEEI